MELSEIYKNGFTSFWSDQKEQAEALSKTLGWKISFVIISYLDADLFVIYRDINCLPEDIRKEIKFN